MKRISRVMAHGRARTLTQSASQTWIDGYLVCLWTGGKS
jgi:hypothetical protein